MLAIMDSFPAECGTPSPSETVYHSIEWRNRYDGLVCIAQIGDKAVAGISGPWSGKFALTWWERPLPARQLELFDSMDEAKHEVEQWAQRMRTGGYSIAPVDVAPRPHLHGVPRGTPEQTRADMPGGLFERMRSVFPHFARSKVRSSSSETIDRLRRKQVCGDTDLSDLHFAANE
jgi:hypothetical protein